MGHRTNVILLISTGENLLANPAIVARINSFFDPPSAGMRVIGDRSGESYIGSALLVGQFKFGQPAEFIAHCRSIPWAALETFRVQLLMCEDGDGGFGLIEIFNAGGESATTFSEMRDCDLPSNDDDVDIRWNFVTRGPRLMLMRAAVPLDHTVEEQVRAARYVERWHAGIKFLLAHFNRTIPPDV